MSGPRRTLRRIEHPGHGRYLTFSCYRRLQLFNNDKIKDAFAKQLDEVHRELRFKLYAWVIMPEHVHLLIQTGDYNLSVARVLTRLKSSFAQRIIRRWRQLDAPILKCITDKSGRTRFWQPGGGYDRNIITDHELLEKIEYIHDNPVRRGLVLRQTDYLWSSAQWYDGHRKTGPVIDPYS